MGVGGWTTVYLTRTSPLSESSVALVVSAYWLALTAGRLVGAVLGARIRSSALLLGSVSGSLLGALIVLLGGGNVAFTAAGTLLVGLSYGPIFPTAVVMATELFPAAPSRAVSLVVALSSLGGMALPPLQGILLERVSPLASVALVAAGAVGMLAVLLVVRRGAAARKPGPSPCCAVHSPEKTARLTDSPGPAAQAQACTRATGPSPDPRSPRRGRSGSP